MEKKAPIKKKPAVKKPAKERAESKYPAVRGQHCTHCGKALKVAFVVNDAKMGFTCVRKGIQPDAQTLTLMRRDRRALRKKLAATAA